MPKELIMRGKTASGDSEVLNFSGLKPGYAYQMTAFELYPSTRVAITEPELSGTVTAGVLAVAPTDPDFNNSALIAVANAPKYSRAPQSTSVINDLFYITQDLILMVEDHASGANPINWQCKFKKVKLSPSAQAVANFNQYTIYNTSS